MTTTVEIITKIAAECDSVKLAPLATPADAGAGLTTFLQAAGAMRLVRCHDGSGKPFEAYDKDIADRVVAKLRAEMHALEDARMSTPGAPVTASDGSSAHLIEAGALRQYQHNDGSDLVFAYDKAIVDREFARLTAPPVIHVAHTYTNSDGAAVIHSLNVHSTIRHDGDSYSAFVDLPPAPVTAEPADLSASSLLKLWERANAAATDTMPAPFQFAKLLLANAPAPADRDAMRDAWQVLLDAGVCPGLVPMSLAEGIRTALKSMERAADAKGEQQ